jgi:hypothetical protein
MIYRAVEHLQLCDVVILDDRPHVLTQGYVCNESAQVVLELRRGSEPDLRVLTFKLGCIVQVAADPVVSTKSFTETVAALPSQHSPMNIFRRRL